MLQVTLPTGTIITITVEDMSDVSFLNVWILGSVVDLHNTKGTVSHISFFSSSSQH
jgi:hypothetical protein